VIEDRIKREEAERLGLYEAEPTDPQLMTHAQLTRNGWAVLTLPPKDNVERQAWVAAFNAREDERETVRKAREEMEELMGASYVPPHAPAWTPEPEDDMEDIAEEDDGCDSIS
jgi:hypothetical protein